MTERTFTIHREGIDRFTAIVDGDEVIAVRAADYDAMETARDMCAQMAHEAEAELAHIKRFLKPTGWQKAQDEHNALRARLVGMQDLYVTACEQRDDALDLLREARPYVSIMAGQAARVRGDDDVAAACRYLDGLIARIDSLCAPDSASVQLVGQDAEAMRESLIAADQPTERAIK